MESPGWNWIRSGAFGNVYRNQTRPEEVKKSIQDIRIGIHEICHMEMLKVPKPHPHLLPLLSYEYVDMECERAIHLYLPYVPSTLDQEMSTLTDCTELMEYSHQLLRALYYMHKEKFMMHRDVTPSNILIDRAKRHLYLSDFGTATCFREDRTYTASVTTYTYAAPETFVSDRNSRITGRTIYDARVDMFSFGLILWEMITLGKFGPFLGRYSSEPSLVKRHKKYLKKQENIWQNIEMEITHPLIRQWLIGTLCWDPNKRMRIEDILTHEND